MTKGLSPKQVAMQKLLALAEDRSFDIYGTSGDIYGERAWPLNWSENLYKIENCSDEEKQRRLDKTLLRLSCGDLPDTVKQLTFEKSAVRLVLEAGADPNATYSREGSIFQAFMYNQKRYGALEIAKRVEFERPENTESTFHILMRGLLFYLKWGKPYPEGTAEEQALNKQTTEDDKELVKVLIKKGIYPHKEEVFKVLMPIMLEDNPAFFEQEKQNRIIKLQRAKTPIQIWAVLTGQQKEKE